MAIEVFTSRLGYPGRDGLNVSSLGNGVSVFVPTFELEEAHNVGAKRRDEYKSLYTEQMRQSFRKCRHAWDEVLRAERVVLLCGCVTTDFCHRVVLAEILHKLGVKYCGGGTYCGEIVGWPGYTRL